MSHLIGEEEAWDQSPTPPQRRCPSASGAPVDELAYVAELAVAVDHFGLDAFASAAAELAHRARHLDPTASKMLTDDSQPTAVRERAFARVCRVLTGAAGPET